MGFNNKSGSLKKMSGYYHRLPDEILDKLEAGAGNDVAQEGADLMRDYINNRGTAKTGKRGRVETGQMLRRVSSKVDRDGKGRLRIQWGWLSGRHKYFRYQEQGYMHMGVTEVEPMHALLDSWIVMTDKIQDEIRRDLR